MLTHCNNVTRAELSTIPASLSAVMPVKCYHNKGKAIPETGRGGP
jgi:hypothetical protein